MLYCWLCYSVSVFCWKRRGGSYECNLVRVVKKDENYKNCTTYLYTSGISWKKYHTTRLRNWIYQALLRAILTALSKTWRNTFDRIPWLTLACVCAPITVSDWWWLSPYGYVMVVTQTGNREDRNSITGGSCTPSHITTQHIYSLSLFSQLSN